MNKTLIIIQREFMTRVKKKSFILLTILMPFIFAALIFVPLWLASIKDTDQKVVKVVDNRNNTWRSSKTIPRTTSNRQKPTMPHSMPTGRTLKRSSLSRATSLTTPRP